MSEDTGAVRRHIIMGAVSVAYLTLMVLLVRREPTVLIGVIAPTIVAAHLYGFRGGLIAGVGGFLANSSVLFVLRHDPWIAENATRTLIGASTNIPLGLLLGANRSLVQKLRAAHTKIEQQSMLDDLTGCCNRRHAFSSLEVRMEESVRHHYPLSIAYIDLDNLKTVNDTHGHARGDELICAFAESAAGAVRKTDTVCRMGGDEFLLILPYCTQACARRVIGRIETTFVRRWSPPDEAVFSYGLASASSTDTLDSLIERADTRMYEQKRLRKAGDVISPSDDEACTPLSRESREGGRT